DPVRRVHQLVAEPFRHRLLTPLPGVADDPADCEGRRAPGPDLDGHLVGGAADAPRADLERGTDVLDRALEHRDGVAARLPLDVGEGVVDDLLGNAALAALEDLVDDL